MDHLGKGDRLVIVEGLDNTGKTSLVGEILEHFPQLEHRPSIGNTHDPEQIARAANKEAHDYRGMKLVVSDRSRIISEFIYTPILKNRPVAYPYYLWMKYISALSRGHHLVIYMTRNIYEIQHSFDQREQLEGVYEHLWGLHDGYDNVMGMLDYLFRLQDPVKSEVWHTTFTSLRSPLFERIERYIKEVS